MCVLHGTRTYPEGSKCGYQSLHDCLKDIYPIQLFHGIRYEGYYLLDL